MEEHVKVVSNTEKVQQECLQKFKVFRDATSSHVLSSVFFFFFAEMLRLKGVSVNSRQNKMVLLNLNLFF